jgi:spore coat protein H
VTCRNAAVVLALALCVAVVSPPRLGAQSSVDPSSADFFGAQALQRLDIDLHTADWSKLKQDFQSNDYYPADVSWNGNKAYNAAVRSRGVASRSGVKPALRLDFNHYASQQSFLGLKSLVLDNLVEDPSGVHEPASMWFFARLAIPAPREVHIVLYVNGEFSGLYAAVEPVDKTFLARVLGNDTSGEQNDGYLYEFNKVEEWWLTYLGPDLDAYKRFFSAKTHESNTDETLYRPIENIVRLINEKPPEELSQSLDPFLDLRAMTRYLAVQNFLGEIDGLSGKWGINNFYLYRLQHHDQHIVIAWDDDLTFVDPSFDLTSYQENNVLVRKLMAIPEYRGLYFATLDEAAHSAEDGSSDGQPGSLEREIRRELELIDAAMLADTRRPFTDTEFLDARDSMKVFPLRRIRYVECEVARVTGARPCEEAAQAQRRRGR